jgi:hypothetical protein
MAKFKAGDRLRRITRKCSTSYHGDIEIGDIVIYDKRDSSTRGEEFFNAVGYGDAGFDERYFELAQFSVGDRVRCETGGYTTIKKGEECVVKSIIDDRRFQGPKTLKNGHYSTKSFTLVEAAKPVPATPKAKLPKVPKAKFKIGDVIKCTGNMYDAVEPNQSATVTNVKGTYMEILVGERKGNGLSYEMKNFEMVEAYEQTPTTTVEETVETKTMAVAIRTTHYIDNTPIQDYSVTEQGDLIERLEGDIKRLQGFDTKTKAIEKQIWELQDDLIKVVELFDSLED